MNKILCDQLALDYCCSAEDVADNRNHFSVYTPLEGRRLYKNDDDVLLKIAVVNNKILFAGTPAMMEWCKGKYVDKGGEWFFEPGIIRELESRLREDGYQIRMLHPFYIADHITPVQRGDYEIKWYEGEEIEVFREDKRWNEALSFSVTAPDVLAVTAERGGEILGMAGASKDSAIMWQIGINVLQEYRGMGIATTLVTLLKNAILKRGILPFYGTSFSHLESQKVALGSGFVPAWVEMATHADVKL